MGTKGFFHKVLYTLFSEFLLKFSLIIYHYHVTNKFPFTIANVQSLSMYIFQSAATVELPSLDVLVRISGIRGWSARDSRMHDASDVREEKKDEEVSA